MYQNSERIIRTGWILVFFYLFFARNCGAITATQIVIVANRDIAESTQLAEYYCDRRDVPMQNIVFLPLGKELTDAISRSDYDSKLANPIREVLSSQQFKGKVQCILLVYGVPYRVGPRGALEGQQEKLASLERQLDSQKSKLKKIESDSYLSENIMAEQAKEPKLKIKQLQPKIDYIKGRESWASVDSELSMVMFEPYELYRWQRNDLNKKTEVPDTPTLMVSRLDGPTSKISQSLVDKAIKVEQTRLKGNVYIDSRGIADDGKSYSYGHYDQSLRDMTLLMKVRTELPIREENTQELFQPGSCPDTAIYAGWYSLAKYIDAFDFADGAIGYHIASLEAKNLHDPNSTQWCPAMLTDGITATLGAVAEPYLHTFPEPKEFFLELIEGKCLVEAYCRTKPFNSWQLILIGDPLYTPFPAQKAKK